MAHFVQTSFTMLISFYRKYFFTVCMNNNDTSALSDDLDVDTTLQNVDTSSFLCGLCSHNSLAEFKTFEEMKKHHKEEHSLHFYTSNSKTVQDFYDFALLSCVEICKANTEISGKIKWLVVINGEGKGIFSIDSEVNYREGIALMQKLKSQMKGKGDKFLVLAHTHGNQSGQNYQFVYKNDDDKVLVNAERLSFIKEDEQYAKLDTIMLTGKCTTVLNSHKYTFDDLKEILINNKSHHVILLFCFSRNDVALRYLLDLETVKSYNYYDSSSEERSRINININAQ